MLYVEKLSQPIGPGYESRAADWALVDDSGDHVGLISRRPDGWMAVDMDNNVLASGAATRRDAALKATVELSKVSRLHDVSLEVPNEYDRQDYETGNVISRVSELEYQIDMAQDEARYWRNKYENECVDDGPSYDMPTDDGPSIAQRIRRQNRPVGGIHGRVNVKFA